MAASSMSTSSTLHRRPGDPALAALVAWTLFVWGGRLRNLARGDEDAPVSLGLAVAFCVLALVVVALRITAPVDRLRVVVRVLAATTVGVWVVRGVQIATADHPIGFIAVHTALALVSIGLAVWAVRSPSTGRDAHEPASPASATAR